MPASKQVIERYGTAEQFQETFDISNTAVYTDSDIKERRCITGTAPTLNLVRDAYGDKTAEIWLYKFIAALFEACGQRPTAEQIDALVFPILRTYGHLKVTDLMNFSVLLRSGQFGPFYGSNDILSLCNYLHEYDKYRLVKIGEYQREADRIKSEIDREKRNREGMSLEDYLKSRKEPLSSTEKHLFSFLATSKEDLQALQNTPNIPEIKNEVSKTG